jgi:hypothetical protein
MKLFRSLRQNLIKEGNIKRYLIYAVGEILLVMIGISLAFQVSNWDDNRIRRNAEIRFYENIKEQIIDDKELIEGQKNYNNYFMAQFKYANKIIETNDRSKLDTLGTIVRDLTNYSDFDKEGNIYETMVNSGDVKLLQNIEIVNGIRELEEIYHYVNRMENIHYDAMMKYVIVAISPVMAFATSEIKKPDAIFTYEFQNLVVMLLQIMDEKDRTYNKALNEIERVTILIDEELDIK